MLEKDIEDQIPAITQKIILPRSGRTLIKENSQGHSLSVKFMVWMYHLSSRQEVPLPLCRHLLHGSTNKRSKRCAFLLAALLPSPKAKGRRVARARAPATDPIQPSFYCIFVWLMEWNPCGSVSSWIVFK